jgi:hypothetical protein
MNKNERKINMTDDKILHINDQLSSTDSLRKLENNFFKPMKPKVFRTEITGYNEFGEKLFTHEDNETVLGGAIIVLEKLANVQCNLKVDSINHIMGINDIVPTAESSATADDILIGWGVGIGGSGDAFGSRRTVQFQEREIGRNGYSGEMVPFRIVSEPFDPTDVNAAKYWLRHKREDGYYEYYGKSFETDPIIRVLYQDGVDGEDGTEVESDVYNTTRTDPIEVFLEMTLKITSKDIREYFEHLDQVEAARFNTLGLFVGRKTEIDTGYIDYTNVKLFSKVTLDNEPLANSKSLTMIYRIFVK